MNPHEPVLIQSRENPLVKQLKRLAHESGAYRKQGRVWVEGEHLCGAALARGVQPELVVFAESAWAAQALHPSRKLQRDAALFRLSSRAQAQLEPQPSAPKGRGRSAALALSVPLLGRERSPVFPPLPLGEGRGEGSPPDVHHEFHKQNWPLAPVHKAQIAIKTVVIVDALWREFTALESPEGMGCVLALPEVPALQSDAPTVVLDRVQDAGNVGSILRSAAAFGFTQIVALKGTALLWSPKVLRAGMGAHFALRLVEGLSEAALDGLHVPLLATSSHQGDWLHRAELPWPCGWLLGHEGQGVSKALQQRAARQIRIAQPGGEESLNVAAAAAICLHASGAGQDRTR